MPYQIHGITSSYFGDYEYDIGKSVRWFQYFCDTEYALDSNLSQNARNYLLAWQKSFPNVSFSYNSKYSFFDSPAEWREESFLRADAKWNYDDDDWVIFIDCSEGLCVDDSEPVPFDPFTPEETDPPEDLVPPQDMSNHNPFKAYIDYEIAAMGDPGTMHTLFIPVWAFVGDTGPYAVESTISPSLQDDLDNGTISIPEGFTEEDMIRLNTNTITTSQSTYSYVGYCPRIIKVSRLRSGSFDWSSLDDFSSTPSDGFEDNPAATLSLITYAYARWAEDPADRNWDQTPKTEASDRGFDMRKLISQVRPIAGFPFAAWTDVDAPSDLYYGYQPDTLLISEEVSNPSDTTGPEFSSDDLDQDYQFDQSFHISKKSAIVPASGGWLDPLPDLRTPLYDNLFRDNPRDGLFYLKDELGPVPWNEVSNSPAVPPEEWYTQLPSKDVRMAAYDRSF